VGYGASMEGLDETVDIDLDDAGDGLLPLHAISDGESEDFGEIQLSGATGRRHDRPKGP
jgi:hypothetical protein